MAFLFVDLCDLLEELEANRLLKALPGSKQVNPDLRTITTWFNQHTRKISRIGPSAVAFLSCLFPERRVDRVYGLKERKLSRALGRCLCLGEARRVKFEKDVDNGQDIGRCVQQVLREAELPVVKPENQVTLEDIDFALDQVAAACHFSCPELRRRVEPKRPDQVLGPIFQRLQSREAKWLTRIVLKNFAPVIVPETVAMAQFHFLLPDLLCFQNSLPAAVVTLEHESVKKLSPRQPGEHVISIKQELGHLFVPQINTFISRQPYDKARSIKHCCHLAQRRQMSVERKYDGEYCQIHIDRTKAQPIRIYSKSGKDSTIDRKGIHDALKHALLLGRDGGPISTRCILEGEILVWSDAVKAVQPFRAIRKHVRRSGGYIGVEQDSPPAPNDHLMVMLYDVMLWDDVACLKYTHRSRRKILKGLVQPIPGHVGIVERQIIDFRSSRANEKLRTHFAQSITNGWEGLVLKGVDDPYSVLSTQRHGIKLKKDYIQGLGDTEDLVILGARNNEQEECELLRAGIQAELDRQGLKKLFWTTFHLGCLENKQDVARWDLRPSYRVVGTVGIHCVSKKDIVLLNALGQYSQVPVVCGESMSEFDIRIDQTQMPNMTTAFRTPFVVEIMGAGFDRPAGVNYPMLRFPRVQKIHEDRSEKDTIGLDELRIKAAISETAPISTSSQADAQWIEKLVKADGKARYIIDHSQITTPGRTPVSTVSSTSVASVHSPTELTSIGTPVPASNASNSSFQHSVSPNIPSRACKRKGPETSSYESLANKRQRSVPTKENPAPQSKRAVSSVTSAANMAQPLAEITSNVAKRSVSRFATSVGAKATQASDVQIESTGKVDEATERDHQHPRIEASAPRISARPPQPQAIPRAKTKARSQALLTPPTSSPQALNTSKAVLVHDARPTTPRHLIQARQVDGCTPDEGPRIPVALRKALNLRGMLLTFSLSNSPKQTKIIHLLEALKGSVTFSRTQFLQHCTRLFRRKTERNENRPDRLPALHIALIDEAETSAEAISNIIDQLMNPIMKLAKAGVRSKRKAADDETLKHALVFLDWHVLEALHQREQTGKTSGSEGNIGEYFWGGFMWPMNDAGNVACTFDLDQVESWFS